jgi:hypothetical protein
MHYYSWSWADLQTTPIYVRRACWDIMMARRSAQNAAR